MMKFERPPMFVLALAIAGVGLCVAHFVAGGGDAKAERAAKQAAKPAPSTTTHDWSREEGQLKDAKLMEEFRESRKTSVMDSKEDAKNKDLARSLRQYGLNPIEMPGGPLGGSAEGIKVIDSPADVKALIESGGYIAGMRPEETDATENNK